ncbi:Smr/MutS family protein [Candidatus Pelagibacter bacterium]|nr:Smr/MutS family protein [Candidatus Pelagibacter bacterium]
MRKKNFLSQGDKKTWEDYIKNPQDIYDKDKSENINKSGKNRFKFDLHGFTLDEANKKVNEIIYFCSENKYREILLVTGKGIHSTNQKDIYVSKDLGKLKYSVPEFIQSNQDLKNLILSIKEASIEDGGKGAILIKLKKL